jgi:flagellar hook-length control protein FliK
LNGTPTSSPAANVIAPAASTFEAGIDDGGLERQIVQAIRLQWQAGVGEATIKLQPEHLGSLTISLKVDGAAVAASVRAESPAAQQWIAAHETDLRSSLERHGLTLERFVVSQDSERQQRFARPQRQPIPPNRPRRQATEEAEIGNYALRIMNASANP